MTLARYAFALFGAALLASTACGSSSSDNVFGSSGGSSGSSGSSGDNSSGSSGAVAFGAGSSGSSGSSGKSGGDGGNCAAPIDMYIMFDRSGSMGNDCAIGGATPSKWCRAINALSGYFSSAGATGQAAALQFFPLPNHTADLCASGDRYAVPALPASDYQSLPTNAFDAILNSTSPAGGGGAMTAGTPTEAAIRGLTRFTSANRRPGRVTIGVLITDGDPRGCNQNLTDLSNLLAAHHTDTTIRTYVIGMQGATIANLEAIAEGGGAPLHDNVVGTLTNACGGTGPCRHWDVGDGNPEAFVAALAAIQQSADGCTPGGGTINPPK